MGAIEEAKKFIGELVGYQTNHNALYYSFKEMARQAFGAMLVGGATWPNMTPKWALAMNDAWTELHNEAIRQAYSKEVSSYSYDVVWKALRDWQAAYETHGANLMFGTDKLARPDLLWKPLQSWSAALDILSDQPRYEYTLTEVANEVGSDLRKAGSEAANFAADKLAKALEELKKGVIKVVTAVAVGLGIVLGGYILVKETV